MHTLTQKFWLILKTGGSSSPVNSPDNPNLITIDHLTPIDTILNIKKTQLCSRPCSGISKKREICFFQSTPNFTMALRVAYLTSMYYKASKALILDFTYAKVNENSFSIQRPRVFRHLVLFKYSRNQRRPSEKFKL